MDSCTKYRLYMSKTKCTGTSLPGTISERYCCCYYDCLWVPGRDRRMGIAFIYLVHWYQVTGTAVVMLVINLLALCSFGTTTYCCYSLLGHLYERRKKKRVCYARQLTKEERHRPIEERKRVWSREVNDDESAPHRGSAYFIYTHRT